MSNIFVLCGKSSSGKDTIYKNLLGQGDLALKRIVPYTTRPMRSKEVEGQQYHFTDEEGLFKLEREGKVIEKRSYNTVHGIWYYFTVDDGFFDDESDHIMIATPEAVKKIREYMKERSLEDKSVLYPIYISVDDGIRLQRALNRELKQETPKYEEMCRRFLSDAADFAEDKLKEAGMNVCFENEDLAKCIEEIRNYIISKRHTA